MKTMKRKLLPKSFFFAVSLFSLFAFTFVNVNVASSSSQSSKSCLVQKVNDVEELQESSIKVPDITVVGKLIDLAQRYFAH